MDKLIYKPKIFQHTDDKDVTWFEVVYFINYNKKEQDIICKGFDTLSEAENYLSKKTIA